MTSVFKKFGCLVAVVFFLIFPGRFLFNQIIGKILFEGVVLDQNNQPIPDANCVMGISGGQVGSFDSGALIRTTSDAQGYFSFYGAVVGAGLTASKEGYYYDDIPETITTLWTRFRPVVLRLHKKGTPVPLICHQTAYIGLSKLGEETGYDLNPPGYKPTESLILQPVDDLIAKPTLRVTAWSDSNFPNYDPTKPLPNFVWHFRVSFPGGGFVPRNSRWDFTAPEKGYEETHIFTATDPNYQGLVPPIKGRYFFRLANGNYGRLELSVGTFPIGGYSPGKNFAELLLTNIYINPTGSRNLESNDGWGY